MDQRRYTEMVAEWEVCKICTRFTSYDGEDLAELTEEQFQMIVDEAGIAIYNAVQKIKKKKTSGTELMSFNHFFYFIVIKTVPH